MADLADVAEAEQHYIINEENGMEMEPQPEPADEWTAQMSAKKIEKLLEEDKIKEKDKQFMTLWNEYAEKRQIKGKDMSKELKRFLKKNVAFIIKEDLKVHLEEHIKMLYKLNIVTEKDFLDFLHFTMISS